MVFSWLLDLQTWSLVVGSIHWHSVTLIYTLLKVHSPLEMCFKTLISQTFRSLSMRHVWKPFSVVCLCTVRICHIREHESKYSNCKQMFAAFTAPAGNENWSKFPSLTLWVWGLCVIFVFLLAARPLYGSFGCSYFCSCCWRTYRTDVNKL